MVWGFFLCLMIDLSSSRSAKRFLLARL